MINNRKALMETLRSVKYDTEQAATGLREVGHTDEASDLDGIATLVDDALLAVVRFIDERPEGV